MSSEKYKNRVGLSFTGIKKMSQKNLEINETKKLNGVFDPSNLGVFYYNTLEIEIATEWKKKEENEIYTEVINGLKSDLINLGFELTYSSEILIGEVALNIILMNRLKTEMMCKDPLRERKVLKPEQINTHKNFELPRDSFKVMRYSIEFLEEKEIDPLFGKLIPQLQKQINDGLKALALLPCQQIERQKLVIIKKLRQRYENVSTEVSIKAEKRIIPIK